MSDHTTIEWTDATWNPVTGCSVISPGCTNCYAMRLAGTRLRNHPSRVGLTQSTKAGPVWNGNVRLNRDWLDHPLRWTRPRRIFVCAHGDLFAEGVPDEWIDEVFHVMARSPQHTFQVLTKRAARMRDYVSRAEFEIRDRVKYDPIAETLCWPLPNIWLGVSVEDQRRADERIPTLLLTPSAVRWLSCEPLLGPVTLLQYCACGCGKSMSSAVREAMSGPAALNRDQAEATMRATLGIDWVVAGGESGPGARPMHPDWARSLRDQCAAHGVPYFFKQWGAWIRRECVEDTRSDPPSKLAYFDKLGATFLNVGKGTAGRLLDGVEHNGMPSR